MSFSTALSGLNAATADLDVKSNNIANVNTTGFKQSRAEFGDVFAVSAFGSTSSTAIGSGVVLQNVAQQFNQGNLEFTDNSLDLAISGEGFFSMAPDVDSGETTYTRAGSFGVNKDGYIVNNTGSFLRTFPVNDNGEISATSMTAAKPLQLPPSAGEPESTSLLSIATNLPSTVVGLNDGLTPPVAALAIDPFDPDTYHNSTSATIFDSLGNEHIVTTYYQKVDPAFATPANTDNQWEMVAYLPEGDFRDAAGDGFTVATGGGVGNDLAQIGAATLQFNTDGTLASTNPATIDFALGTLADPAAVPPVLESTVLSSGAGAQLITLNVAGSTQNSGAFSVNALTVNGFPTGRLTGVDISDSGLVRATYSNGQAIPIGKLALANFANVQALNKIGSTAWKETSDSGSVIAGEAGTGSFGNIQSGALETSNVDLTRELVGLITAQRNFQANSKSIETENAITQTIINLR